MYSMRFKCFVFQMKGIIYRFLGTHVLKKRTEVPIAFGLHMPELRFYRKFWYYMNESVYFYSRFLKQCEIHIFAVT